MSPLPPHRRIKCDGQQGICGRCQDDNRPDCKYENVGSQERLAGRQRKRALRKQYHFTTSSPTNTLHSPPTSRFLVSNEGEWSSNIIKPTHSQPPPHISSSASYHDGGKSEDSASLAIKTPPSSHSFGSSYHEESTQPSFFGSTLASSLGPTEAHLSNGPSFSWVSNDSPPQAPLRLNGSCFDPSNTESLLIQQPHANTGLDADYAGIDALWRVYDWQYRCNSGIPLSHPYVSQPVPTPSCQQ